MMEPRLRFDELDLVLFAGEPLVEVYFVQSATQSRAMISFRPSFSSSRFGGALDNAFQRAQQQRGED